MNLQDIAEAIKYVVKILARGYLYVEMGKNKLEYETRLQLISKITQIMIGWRTVALAVAIALPVTAKYMVIQTKHCGIYLLIGLFGLILIVLWLLLDNYFDKKITAHYEDIRKLEIQLNIKGLYEDAYESGCRRRWINLLIPGIYISAFVVFWLI
ncbi:hypothetical protein ACFLYE_00260 [Chloroflexota bacterium]